ncbi:MAG: hypothetical protein VX701_02135 [Chloroflexota bacterium]|nr:hypothetical protein [Chloroflexota bacterium]
MILIKICGLAIITLFIISCDGDSGKNDANNVTRLAQGANAVSIEAAVCKKRVEGSVGSSIQLNVQNLNDFEWKDVTLIGQDFSNQTYQIHVEVWPPETTKTAEPFTESKGFKIMAAGTSSKGSSRLSIGQGLTTFSLLSTLSIVVDEPVSTEWKSELGPCQ